VRQYNTNMDASNYHAYCSAWCLIYLVLRSNMADEIYMFNSAVRKGIVFG
jgi:hypothetical protein